jgi:phosphatidylglycerophosphate synthase
VIDRFILPLQSRALTPLARALAARGVRADGITLGGFAIGILAVPLLAAGLYPAALCAILMNRLADGLDGAVARLQGPTDRGAFLDIALDFFFYAAVPFGFALADPGANGLAAAALILAFVGTGSSFLAFASVAARRGMASDAYPKKGIFYLGGLTEGFETIAVFCLMCLMPQWFAPLAWVFAVACLLTTLTRWLAGWRAFG